MIKSRNFISAGAAAGIASAFGAPVGGLLFAMEEVSSFWSMSLSWQVLFCSMTSTFTTDLFNSAFTGFSYTGDFGQFKTDKYILFQIDSQIDLNILGIIPSVILGVIGGLLGSLFIFMNLKFARLRLRLRSQIMGSMQQKLARMSEPLMVMLISCTISILAPGSIHCQYVPSCNPNVSTVALPRIRPYKPPTSSCADLRFFFFYTNCKQFTEL